MVQVNVPGGFAMVPRTISLKLWPTLRASEVRVHAVLLSKRFDATGLVSIGIEQLAQITGLSERGVRYAIAQLVARGVIQVTRAEKRGSTRQYRVPRTVPKTAYERVEPTPKVSAEHAPMGGNPLPPIDAKVPPIDGNGRQPIAPFIEVEGSR